MQKYCGKVQRFEHVADDRQQKVAERDIVINCKLYCNVRLPTGFGKTTALATATRAGNKQVLRLSESSCSKTGLLSSSPVVRQERAE